MPQTTPMQARMNEVYDEIRAVLGRTHPDVAEAERLEIVLLLVMIKREVRDWQDANTKRRHAAGVYRRNSIFDAFDIDTEKMQELARKYTEIAELLT